MISKEQKNNLEQENKRLKIEVGLLNSGYFQLKKTTEQLKESEEKFLKAFDTAPYAISITRVRDNKLIDVNRAFSLISGFSKEEVLNNSSRSLKLWCNIKDRVKIIDILRKGGEVRDHEIKFKRKDGKIILGLFSATQLFVSKEACIISSITDITERKHLEKKLFQKSRAMEMLSASNQALVHSVDEKQFLNQVCKNVIKIGGYSLTWIGLLEYDKAKTIRPVAYAGLNYSYVKSVKLTWSNTERGRGPGGTAARTGKVVVIKDILNNSNMGPWKKNAKKGGYNSTIFLPLFKDKEVIGILGVYSKEVDAFDEEEIKVIKELADDLSFGINNLRTVSESKKAQESLINSEAKFRSLFETSRDGIIIVDAKTGVVKEINYYFIELLGYSPNEFLRKKIWTIKLFKKILSSKIVFDKLKLKKYTKFENIPMYTSNGSLIMVDFIINIYSVNRTGSIQFMIRDVTERYNLEEQVSQSEKRYSTLVEKSNDAVVLIQDGIIKYANPAISNIVNLTPQNIVGRMMLDFISPEFRKIVGENYKRRMSGEKVDSRYELAVLDSNGKSVPVEANNSLITYDGRPADISVLRDITRSKQIEKVKSDFISVASHQLRTPLTGIKWFSQLLINGKVGSLTDKQVDFIRQIYESNERMIHLTNDLLQVSHIENGQKFAIEKTPSDILTLVKKVISDQKNNYPTKKVDIEIDSDCPNKLIFNFDHEKMYEVFSNLISNAIKYSKEDIKIIIKLRCSKKEVTCAVRDFGFGIPIHQQDRIFQKFFRADNIVRVSTEGTGLGLYIAKGMVEAHGGKMWFESEQNKGTTFFFTLPLNDKK